MSIEPVTGEAAIVQEFLAPLAAGYPGAFGLADDCAAFTPTPGHDLVVKTDPVAAGVHFFPDDAPEDIAWKALAVNVSDLAAKAAIPRAYLMALSFPEAPARDWMGRFANGLATAQSTFGMHLIGGDTDKRPGPVTISITAFGEVPAGQMVRRGAAKAGDLIYVSGTLGDAGAGLMLRRDRASARTRDFSDAAVEFLVARYLRPQPRLALKDALRPHARAAMDVSDGLAKDLGRMCRASGCGAAIDIAKLPLSDALRAPRTDWSWQRFALASGDDYEILCAVRPETSAAFEQAAASGGIPVTRIGHMTAGGGLTVTDIDGRPLDLDITGWDHF